jgi:hypothetical protein
MIISAGFELERGIELTVGWFPRLYLRADTFVAFENLVFARCGDDPARELCFEYPKPGIRRGEGLRRRRPNWRIVLVEPF